MSGLVACYNDALGIGKVADAGVFQTIELVRAGKAKGFPDSCPFLPKAVYRYRFLARYKVFPK